MSSKEYNLSDNVNDNFGFELRGLKYEMRYPRTEELEEIRKMTVELEEARRQENSASLTAAINKKMESFMYALITANGHETSIEQALKSENIKVLQNFNKMVQAELAV